jgi:hypothetical protein
MERSIPAGSPGSCPTCLGWRYTLEHRDTLEGLIRYIKRPCPLCGPTFTYVVEPENTFSASMKLVPDDCADNA